MPNLKIIWGDLIISDLFDVINIDEPPAAHHFSYKQEIMANGKARTVASVNNELNFSITVNRDVVNHQNFELLQNAFLEVKSKRLRLIKEDGTVLIEYKNALLADSKFMMGSVEDGKGVDTKITWSVANG